MVAILGAFGHNDPRIVAGVAVELVVVEAAQHPPKRGGRKSTVGPPSAELTRVWSLSALTRVAA